MSIKKFLVGLAIVASLSACGPTAAASSGRYRQIDTFDGADGNPVFVFCDTKTGHLVYVYEAYHGGGIAIDAQADCRQ